MSKGANIQSVGSESSDFDEDEKVSFDDDRSRQLSEDLAVTTSLLGETGVHKKRQGQPLLGSSPSSSNGGMNGHDSFWWIRHKELGPTGRGEGWRHSKSSVSTVFYSAEDVTDYMSEISTNSGDTLCSHQSYHSAPRLGDGDSDLRDDHEDIFSSPTQSPIQERKQLKSVAFSMAVKDVDFVLVWDSAYERSNTQDAKDRREIYERNLQEEGLVLEHEKLEASTYNFVKIHAPHEVLCRYAEILKLKMKMKDVVDLEEKWNAFSTGVRNCWNFSTSWFKMDPRLFAPKDKRLSAVYSRDREYLFDMNDENFFTSNTRSQIVEFILSRKRYSLDNYDDFAFGIDRLRILEVYCAHYPLHDGDLRTPGSLRYLLHHEWAAIRTCFKYQPLDAVKDYFGVKVALYFAWLGFYTHYLIPASILGVICFLYGVFTLYSNTISEDICDESKQIILCPLCDKLCDFYRLSETCSYARVTYLFDNNATVAFAVLMSFWTAIYLEMWKRYSARIGYLWDVGDFDVHEEHPREEYLVRLKNVRRKNRNRVTLVEEPKVPFWKMKVPYVMFSLSMVLFLISMAVAAVIGVIVYRLAVAYSFAKISKDQNQYTEYYSYYLLIVNTSAAVINLIFIFFFNWLYGLVAQQLTEMELHRTQSQFEDSLTLKMYLLQFINYYSSIFYIAFFKGKFVGSPHKYTTFLGFRQEECAPGGCMTELCLQLAIILVGKQILNMFTETGIPMAMKYWNQLRIFGRKKLIHKELVFGTQWAKDLKLLEWDKNNLFEEYLEMVLQYGFVTIFVAAFPLAPLFALLNNIFEMRLDAKKMISFYRRPVGSCVRNIGIWYGIMDGVGKLAVISNAFIIAFTSSYIPKLVYMYGIPDRNPTHTLEGYVEDSLAYFDVQDSRFKNYTAPTDSSFSDVKVCRYQEYRSNYTLPDGERYKRTSHYWKVWMARLAFIVIFENIVALAVMLVKWLIPDIPSDVKERMRRESYLTNEIIIKQEMTRARGISSIGDSTGINPISEGADIELDNVGPRYSNSHFNPKGNSTSDDNASAEVMV